mgnify:CR=1 FL=1
MPPAKESATWHAHYGDEKAIARRRRDIGEKLDRLGVGATSRDAKILDVCCGHGETLESLYSLGFRNLHGVDLKLPGTLLADARFAVKEGDALRLDYHDASFDGVFCIHSLHHLAKAENVQRFLEQAYRVLRPGGRLFIIDFPASTQIRVAFWLFRQNSFLITPYLQWFGKIIQEEWWFLKGYLSQWPQVRRQLLEGPFTVERHQPRFFYYYLTLRKPDFVAG